MIKTNPFALSHALKTPQLLLLLPLLEVVKTQTRQAMDYVMTVTIMRNAILMTVIAVHLTTSTHLRSLGILIVKFVNVLSLKLPQLLVLLLL